MKPRTRIQPTDLEVAELVKISLGGDRSFRSVGNLYYVSDDGVVVSAKRDRVKILQHDVSPCGHHRVMYYTEGTPHFRWVHRLMLEAFVGPPPSPTHQVRHLDGNPHNNRLGNLCWGTAKENAADRVRHGTSPVGEKNPRAKLSLEQVESIRNTSGSSKELAAKFGVHRNTIWHIRAGKFWGAS